MGCNFDFYNKTRNEKTKDLKHSRLYRNIDRGAYSHLLKIFNEVIRINGWSEDDEIKADCCCELLVYEKGKIESLYNSQFSTEIYECECEMCTGKEEIKE